MEFHSRLSSFLTSLKKGFDNSIFSKDEICSEDFLQKFLFDYVNKGEEINKQILNYYCWLNDAS